MACAAPVWEAQAQSPVVVVDAVRRRFVSAGGLFINNWQLFGGFLLAIRLSLFGCGMIFGAMLGSSGLAETIGSGLNNMLGVSSALVITAIAAGVDPVIRRWPLPSAHPYCCRLGRYWLGDEEDLALGRRYDGPGLAL